MTKALPGEHLCAAHQGNHSHYAEHNCTICKLIAENAELRPDAEKWREHMERIRLADECERRLEG